MDALTVLRWFVTTQLLLGLLLVLLRASRPAPRTAVRIGHALFVSAFLAPILVQFLPAARIAPAAQLWSAPDWSPAPTLAIALGSTPAAPVVVENATPWLLGGISLLAAIVIIGFVPLGTAAVSLHRLLRESVVVRRAGRLRIAVVGTARIPFAAALPQGAWVVLDPATFADPDRRRIAVHHEIQHHRHGDPVWAWIVLAFGVLGASTPIVSAWRRTLAEQEELAVDTALVAHRRVSARSYAEALLHTAEQALEPPVACPGLTVSGSSSQLKWRVRMLLNPTGHSVRSFAWIAWLGVPLAFGTAWAADSAVLDHRVPTSRAEAVVASAHTEIPLVVNDLVVRELNRFVGTPAGRRYVTAALEARRGAMGELVDDALEEAGLPAELAAVVLVESGFRNLGAPSVGGGSYAPGIPGAGVWMFIPATARRYGLRVDAEIDERLDPALETGAAVALLSDLHERYGDWWLAFAGYNQGERFVDAAIASAGTRDAFELSRRGALNEYVPQVAAATLILEDPSLVR